VSGERSVIFVNGANALLDLDAVPDTWLHGRRVVSVGSIFALPQFTGEAVGRLFVRAKAYGATTVLNICWDADGRGFANSRSSRLAAFSRLLSRCYPWSYRTPVLRLFCADGISNAQRTICVLSLHSVRRCRQMQGKVDVQVGAMHIHKLSCCQDVIVPLSEDKYLSSYASCCTRCFWA
jgi:hypothetical protein